MILPVSIYLTEVGPRDGLQSVGATIATDDKVELIDALARSGLRRIEATSFVHPRLVPSMADAEAVMERIERLPGVRYMALVPNVRGAERAIAAHADELNVVLSVTETFNQRNLNMSVEDSINAYGAVSAVARAAGIPAEVGLSVVFGCPYEGEVQPQQVFEVVDRLLDVGAEEILFADTIGIANPRQVQSLVEALLARWPSLTIGLHFHDTRGLGLANVLAGLQAGVSRFDASAGGIGACPFAPGATGNICTEDTVYMLHAMGVDTGVDLEALIGAAALIPGMVGREVPSRMLRLRTGAATSL
jgi:hydroxymethylglutaryl-CoA lyase